MTTDLAGPLTPQQAGDLVRGYRRGIQRGGTRRLDGWSQARAGRRMLRCRSWELAADRADGRLREAREALAVVPPAHRPYGRLAATFFTALLMCASYFTIRSVLSSADLSPLEAGLLPLAFGPVFVLSVKTAVAAWLAARGTDVRPSGGQRLMTRLVGPVLAVAAAALICGVGLKSAAVGSLIGLQDEVAAWSSVLMFGGLALGELAGAAALGVYQHRPGASAYLVALDRCRWALLASEYAHRQADTAAGRLAAGERALATRAERRATLTQLELARGWQRAAGHATATDELLERLSLERLVVVAPSVPVGPAAHPLLEVESPRWTGRGTAPAPATGVV